MNHPLTQEVAQAIRRGEVDYAETLHDMGLVRVVETSPVHVDRLNDNQQLGYENYERKIRCPA